MVNAGGYAVSLGAFIDEGGNLAELGREAVATLAEAATVESRAAVDWDRRRHHRLIEASYSSFGDGIGAFHRTLRRWEHELAESPSLAERFQALLAGVDVDGMDSEADRYVTTLLDVQEAVFRFHNPCWPDTYDEYLAIREPDDQWEWTSERDEAARCAERVLSALGIDPPAGVTCPPDAACDATDDPCGETADEWARGQYEALQAEWDALRDDAETLQGRFADLHGQLADLHIRLGERLDELHGPCGGRA